MERWTSEVCLPEDADLKERGMMPTRKLAANMAADWRRRRRMGMAAWAGNVNIGCTAAYGVAEERRSRSSNLEEPSRWMPPLRNHCRRLMGDRG